MKLVDLKFSMRTDEDRDMRATGLELEDSTGSHDCDQPQFSSGQNNESEFFFFMLYRQDKSLST